VFELFYHKKPPFPNLESIPGGGSLTKVSLEPGLI